MAVENFRFVSPGVQVNEIDNSVLPVVPPKLGPLVIGRTRRGPLMQPFTVTSIPQLETVFGPASNGIVGLADVWRTGVPTAPTFATYAAQAYLKNNDPVTVVRVGGIPAVGSLKPGWKITQAKAADTTDGSEAGAIGIIIHDKEATNNSTEAGGVGTLVGVIYASGALVKLANASNGKSSRQLTTGDKTFKISIKVGTGEAKEYPVSVETLRSVLNTNPTALGTEHYFLGETFEKSIVDVTDKYVSLVELEADASNYEFEVKNAETPYIISDGTSPVPLFKLVGLEGGANDSRDLKISIEDIKPASFPQVDPYATFSVVVRALFEGTDEVVYEKFENCSLNVNSSNYVAKRIGTMHRKWDVVNGVYTEEGEYANVSKFVRVEMAANSAQPSAYPYGFQIPKFKTVVGIVNTTTQIPALPLKGEVTINSAKTKNVGLLSDPSTNADLVDFTARRSLALAQDASTANFSLGYYKAKKSDNTDVTSQADYSKITKFTYETTLAANDYTKYGLIKGFDVPLMGGFDGLDVTQREPIINNDSAHLGTDNTFATEIVNRALDIIAPAEVVDFNTLCVPNVKNATLQAKMLQICKARGDALAVIDLANDYKFDYENGGSPAVPSVEQAISSIENYNNSYGAAYFPAVFVPSAGIYMPASIAALGAFGGNDARSAVWFAPAGFSRGGLSDGTSGLAVSKASIALTSAQRDRLYENNINPIATFPGAGGVVIFGQKTLQRTPSALDRVNVRRLVNHVKKEVSRAAVNVIFEPNVKDTWDNFKDAVNPFLANIKVNYGLEEAKVVLDEKTTTADLVDRNTMYCKIYLKPTRAIEFIAIDLIVTNSGAVFTE
jgi:phage tail sheath protein FI